MGPIARPQITFGCAVHAAGITEKALRNWLDKGQVTLQGDDEREQGQWRRFSLIDVVRLAIVGALVRYGIPVSTAVELIGNVDHKLLHLAQYKNAPRGAVQATLRGVRIFVSKGGTAEGGDNLNVRLTYGEADTPDISGLRHYVALDAGQIANDVLGRLDADDEALSGPPE